MRKTATAMALLAIWPTSAIGADPAECRSDTTAFVMSQGFVKRQLKAPSTAAFPYITADGVKVAKFGSCQFAVIAYVDSQNSFGAKIRSRYAMKVRYDPVDKKWYGTDLVIQ